LFGNGGQVRGMEARTLGVGGNDPECEAKTLGVEARAFGY
jgi:hypothetical protein